MMQVTRDEPMQGLSDFLHALANSPILEYGPPPSQVALAVRNDTIHRLAREVQAARAIVSKPVAWVFERYGLPDDCATEQEWHTIYSATEPRPSDQHVRNVRPLFASPQQ